MLRRNFGDPPTQLYGTEINARFPNFGGRWWMGFCRSAMHRACGCFLQEGLTALRALPFALPMVFAGFPYSTTLPSEFLITLAAHDSMSIHRMPMSSF